MFLCYVCSSLLIVYEGLQTSGLVAPTTLQPYTMVKQESATSRSHLALRAPLQRLSNGGSLHDNRSLHSSFYEHEASNSSDCLSHSDESHGDDDDITPRPNGFVPISEETVFLDSPPIESGACATGINHHCVGAMYSSSPMSVDSCMMYSDCSQYTESSEEASSDMDMSNHGGSCVSTQLWRQPTMSVTEQKWVEATRARNIPRVDVRMIDFAHTTFGASCANSLVHLGPDSGFITGLDSLRRLLTEILAEG